MTDRPSWLVDDAGFDLGPPLVSPRVHFFIEGVETKSTRVARATTLIPTAACIRMNFARGGPDKLPLFEPRAVKSPSEVCGEVKQ